MDRYTETFETWNNIAQLYETKFMDLDLYDESYESICNSISKNKARILEIGCGPGNMTKYILSKRPDFDIFGIDIAPRMIELAKKNNPEAKFDVMDVRDLHKIHLHYDGIVGGFCLPYLSHSDSIKLIEDCSKLLNDNGLLYLSFVEGQTGDYEFQVGARGDRVCFYFHNLDELKTQLTKNNFGKFTALMVEYSKSENEIEVHTILTAKKLATA